VGPSALFARYEERGARLLIDQVNRAGGINGRQIELVYYDTEGKADRAAALYRRLATEDRVAAVIGPDSILVVLGMSSVPKEVRTMSVAAPGTYELIKEDDRDWIVTAWTMGGFAQSLILGYFKQRLGVQRIGVVTTADVIGEHTDRIIRNVAQLLGLEVVKTVAQPASDRDMLPSL
jgi:branched-chain amino acid transport system substrate-binding protein